jgi:phage protein D
MSETPPSRDPVYSARPTVRVDGSANARVAELLVGMRMVEREGGLSSLELRLINLARGQGGDSDYAFEDEAVVHLGSVIEIYAGDAQSPRAIFRGLVTGLEAEFHDDGAPELTILAEDSLQKARMARRTALHEEVSLADLASRVAQAAGLRAVTSGLADSLGTQVQLDESDLAFLRRLLANHDGDVQVVGDELHVSARADVQRGTIELAMFSQLRRARLRADLAQQVTELTTAGWDPSQGRRVTGSARGAQLGPGGGRSGARLLEQSVGARREHVGHLSPTTTSEARALADAAFDRRARRFVVVEGTAVGNPGLRVGSHVRLSGLSHRFNNTFYVVSACHRFDLGRGYETDFEAECAYLEHP